MNKQKLSVHTLMCLLACATAACSNDLDQKEIPATAEGERITVTATADMPQGQPSTRLDFEETTDGTDKLKITWRAINDPKGRETFSVLPATGSTTPPIFTLHSVDPADAHKASFTGEITPADGATYYAVYPALPTASATAATAIPLEMTGQTGDALDESKVYMSGSSTYTSGGTLDFGFQHLTSIVKATLKFPEALAGATASDVTFIATGGLHTNADADITSTPITYSNHTTGSLALSNTFLLSNDANAETTVYLHILPDDALTDFKVKAKVDGKSYIGTVSASTTITAGKMYTKTVVMVKNEFEVNTTIPSGAAYNYDGMEIQIGTWQAGSPIQTTLATTTIANGKAVFELPSALSADTKIWVCIPRVVKYFHTLTASETNGLTLPDKDGGSTLKANPVAGGKPYENDWIVGLYMGVNKDGSTDATATPIYWATGNLIATKTNAANSGSTTAAFHIATPAETESEAANSYIPYWTSTAGAAIYDSYKRCPPGDQWNKFGWGDATGLMAGGIATNYAPYITSPNQSISGNDSYDIALAQLGGSWRLPNGGTNNEFAAFADSNNPDLLPNGEDWTDSAGTYIGRKYIHMISDAGSVGNTITNTLMFPKGGYRNDKDQKAAQNGFYWSGTVSDKINNPYYFVLIQSNGSMANSWLRSYGQTVRPVSE